jgi:signal transduction histidine kinase
VLGASIVGAPVRQLVEKARRVGRGDLASPLLLRSHDELGLLASEMNAMCDNLAAAMAKADAETAARISALEQLRHADRLRTVGQLASALAHELGTPLNVVSGHTRLIEQDPAANDAIRESTRTIIEQASRMISIIRDLLGFARKRVPQVADQDLTALAQQAARTLQPLAQRHRVTFKVECENAVHARADAQQLLQALTNLLNNAMQAMPHGGLVRVCIEAREIQPPTGVHAPVGRYASIAVIDTGVGIEEVDVPHLFEPFFTRKSEGEGTGLGLSVVEGIAKEHRGWVNVHSVRGEGSRFEMFLPMFARSTPENTHPSSAATR